MFKKLLDFNNVVATGKASLSLANLFGNTVDRIQLQLGGTALTKAMLTQIRILANEKVIFDDLGSNTDSRMQYRGIAANAAFLVLDFSEIRARTILGQKTGALDTTAGLRTLNMEVQITGATAPTLAGYAELSEPQTGADFQGLIAGVKRITKNFGAAGTFAWEMSYGANTPILIKRLHFFGATVTNVEIKKRGISLFEAVPDAVNDYDQGEYQRTPQANVYTVDFIKDGNMSNALRIAPGDPMEYRVTVSGAGNVECVAEILDVLNNF